MKRFEELTFKKLEQMKEEGKTEKEISEYFDVTVTTFRLVKAGMLHARWLTQSEIAKRMRERGMSRKEIAECIGVSESTLKEWETGDAVD